MLTRRPVGIDAIVKVLFNKLFLRAIVVVSQAARIVPPVYSTTCTSESLESDVARLSLLRKILLLGCPSKDTAMSQ